MNQNPGPKPGMSPSQLRQSLRAATAPQPPTAQAAPTPAVPPADQVPKLNPLERVMEVRAASNDAIADLMVRHLLEFIENCPATADDSYAVVDTLMGGSDQRTQYAFEAHLVMLLVRIKNSLPDILHRTLQEVGARFESLTYEQQCDILFSILRESVTTERK